MAWAAPITHAVGDILTASDWNISSNDLTFLAGAAMATVATSQTTSSASYGALATVGPAVTVTTGANAIVLVSASMSNSSNNFGCAMAPAVSGATTIAATDANSVQSPVLTDPAGTVTQVAGLCVFIASLTAGSNTFTAQYKVTGGGGTGTFLNRNIAVFPLP